MPTNTDPGAAWRLVPAPAPALSLDFANTRYWRGAAAPTESLTGFAALVRWLVGAGVVDAETASRLQALGDSDPKAAQALFDDALRLREVLYRLFAGLTLEAAPADDVQLLGALLASTPPRQHWVFDGLNSGWRLAMQSPSLAEVLAPVLWSAADLTLSLSRVPRVCLRACANPQCRWLFIDDSKGGSRRWCSMSACGNRAKVQRHYLRKTGREPADA